MSYWKAACTPRTGPVPWNCVATKTAPKKNPGSLLKWIKTGYWVAVIWVTLATGAYGLALKKAAVERGLTFDVTRTQERMGNITWSKIGFPRTMGAQFKIDTSGEVLYTVPAELVPDEKNWKDLDANLRVPNKIWFRNHMDGNVVMDIQLHPYTPFQRTMLNFDTSKKRYGQIASGLNQQGQQVLMWAGLILPIAAALFLVLRKLLSRFETA